MGVRGYPTIKHGDPNNLEDYKGGRDYSALEKFAKGLKYGQERFHIRARESFFFCRIWQHSQYVNVFWIFEENSLTAGNHLALLQSRKKSVKSRRKIIEL